MYVYIHMYMCMCVCMYTHLELYGQYMGMYASFIQVSIWMSVYAPKSGYIKHVNIYRHVPHDKPNIIQNVFSLSSCAHTCKKKIQPYILSVYLSGVTVRSRPMRTPQTYSLYLHLSLSGYTMYICRHRIVLRYHMISFTCRYSHKCSTLHT